MVIPMCRRSPACRGLGADTPGVLQRTAELIPNQLRFSVPPTLHPLVPVESDSGRTQFHRVPCARAQV